MRFDPSRRSFIEQTALGAGLAAFGPAVAAEPPQGKPAIGPESLGHLGKLAAPLAIATWDHGLIACRGAVRILQVGGSVLDALEKGINVVERDPTVDSVGVGGIPNEEGEVELDAAIMDWNFRCGSVMGLRMVATPISVARRVMEKTRHVQLVGDGALQFAIESGFEREELLTPEAKAKWQAWRDSPERRVPGQVDGRKGTPPPSAPPAAKGPPAKEPPAKEPPAKDSRKAPDGGGHDTIAALALDQRGLLAAGCSTSGLAFKMPGRVGDSPIIGAGLYCDGEIGAAGATGIGEEILRVCGSFFIVECMRQGQSPQEATEAAIRRVLHADPKNRERQVAFIALSRDGHVGASCILPGFKAAVVTGDGQEFLVAVRPLKG